MSITGISVRLALTWLADLKVTLLSIQGPSFNLYISWGKKSDFNTCPDKSVISRPRNLCKPQMSPSLLLPHFPSSCCSQLSLGVLLPLCSTTHVLLLELLSISSHPLLCLIAKIKHVELVELIVELFATIAHKILC